MKFNSFLFKRLTEHIQQSGEMEHLITLSAEVNSVCVTLLFAYVL